jgi:hypothetical protein
MSTSEWGFMRHAALIPWMITWHQYLAGRYMIFLDARFTPSDIPVTIATSNQYKQVVVGQPSVAVFGSDFF